MRPAPTRKRGFCDDCGRVHDNPRPREPWKLTMKPLVSGHVNLDALGEKICREEPAYLCPDCQDTGQITSELVPGIVRSKPCEPCVYRESKRLQREEQEETAQLQGELPPF